MVPADAVLDSGSGLDPDISIDNAMMQAPRVAAENGISEDVVKSTDPKTRARQVPVDVGRARVNVLELNIALKDMKENRTS